MYIIRSRNGGIGHVDTLRKQTLRSPNAVRVRMPPALNSERFTYPHTSSCMTGMCRCPVSSARSAQKFSGKKKNKNMKK